MSNDHPPPTPAGGSNSSDKKKKKKGKKRDKKSCLDSTDASLLGEESTKTKKRMVEETVAANAVGPLALLTTPGFDDMPNQGTKRARKKPSQTRKDTERPTYAFQVDETDHCETPLEAYRDMLELLDKIASSLGKSRSSLLIYDPYFCNGGVERKLKSLGFTNVVNRNSDFYDDIATQSTPEYDVLLTNPPYSGVHMEKLLSFCVKQRPYKPFLLLLPHYVYTKDYYDRSLGGCASELYFMIPESRYSYVPPKWVTSADGSRALAKGKEKTAPFPSFWYCGVNKTLISTQWLVSNYGPSGMVQPRHSSKIRFAQCTRDIPRDFKGEFDTTKKRANPKARKRASKKRRETALAGAFH